MNYDLLPEEREVADRVQALRAEASLPEPGSLAHAPCDRVETATRRWLEELGRAGYLRLGVGPSRRGELVVLLAAQQELARGSGWLLFATEMGRLVASLVDELDAGGRNAALRDAWMRGERILAVAFSEPSSGAAPERLDTTARVEDGQWVLSGEKAQVSMAPMADALAVYAWTGEGPAVFLVERNTPGLRVGERIHTLGYEPLHTSPVTLEGVRVPDERRLAADDGAALMERLRDAEDRTLTAASLGILWRCLEHAQRAADRPRAHGKPPAGYQLVRFSLAEMLTLAQTAQILAYRAFSALAADDPEARTLLLCAKVFATEAACKVSDQAMQILASSGYRRGNPVERALRNARLGTIVGHTSEVARMAIADDVIERMTR